MATRHSSDLAMNMALTTRYALLRMPEPLVEFRDGRVEVTPIAQRQLDTLAASVRQTRPNLDDAVDALLVAYATVAACRNESPCPRATALLDEVESQMIDAIGNGLAALQADAEYPMGVAAE